MTTAAPRFCFQLLPFATKFEELHRLNKPHQNGNPLVSKVKRDLQKTDTEDICLQKKIKLKTRPVKALTFHFQASSKVNLARAPMTRPKFRNGLMSNESIWLVALFQGCLKKNVHKLRGMIWDM